MKRCAVAVFTLAVLSVAALTLSAPDVSGIWDLEMRWVGATETITSGGECRFTQEQDVVSGTCGGGTDRFPIVGEITGNRLSWHVDVKQSGSAGRLEFVGEIDERGTTIRGSCRVVGIQDGTFIMTKQP